MNKWKILAIMLLVSMVLILLADNLLFVPKLIQRRSITVGICKLDLPFDWYYRKAAENEYAIDSVNQQEMIFGIVAQKELSRINFDSFQQTFSKTGNKWSQLYSIGSEQVLEIKNAYGSPFEHTDLFFLKKRRLEIVYMGDVADKYKTITYLINHSKVITSQDNSEKGD